MFYIITRLTYEKLNQKHYDIKIKHKTNTDLVYIDNKFIFLHCIAIKIAFQNKMTYNKTQNSKTKQIANNCN